MECVDFVIKESDSSLGRLDKVLTAYLPSHSRSYIQFLFENEAILHNGAPCKKRVVPRTGDTISVTLLPLPEINASPEDIPLEIVYEDEYLLVINKPAHRAVHPAPGSPQGTIVNALLHRYREFAAFGDEIRPGIVHRLDKDTTGILLVAKTPKVQHALSAQFAAREVDKRYLAITYGLPKEGIVDAPIGRSTTDRKKMAIREDGKSAQSRFIVLERKDPLTLVEIELLTGRTHQIRVHAKYLNAPILGDPTYGIDHINKKYAITSQLLHAWKLSFIHPISKKYVTIDTPPPSSFSSIFEHIPPENSDKT